MQEEQTKETQTLSNAGKGIKKARLSLKAGAYWGTGLVYGYVGCCGC